MRIDFNGDDWIDTIREASEVEIGLLTDNDYALIVDRKGNLWSTETLPRTSEQIKTKLDVREIVSELNKSCSV